ncbi:MAG: MFS transporter [Bryobacterales bacterium]|nr:MFS transporter [Bryobacterales bacterium]MEB2362453.1 MFS transporter [Bryobacterales bacterium]
MLTASRQPGVPFWTLLLGNRNYRYTWLGQIVSEAGDHFNTIAVLSLALHTTGSGAAVGGVMLARTLGGIAAGPIAGVVLDRMDRKRVMIASDLFRAVAALAFVLVITHKQEWLLYFLSASLMFASPFFTSGRSAILPDITRPEELHTANALTLTTAWLTLSIGAFLGGASTMRFGYECAFAVNAFSFLFSAGAISRLKPSGAGFRAGAGAGAPARNMRAFWDDFRSGMAYIRSTPLVLGIALVLVGWASGGGAAQILFTLYGELVFKLGPSGVGFIWGSAGIGLVAGGFLAHWLGPHLNFARYKHAIAILLFVHGAAYVLFAVSPDVWWAVLFIALSRVGMGTNNILNRTMLLHHVPNRFRGRVFSAMEMILNGAMMISMTAASVAAVRYPVRTIGVIAGVLSTSTALFWAAANYAGRLPEPPAVPEQETDQRGPTTPA